MKDYKKTSSDFYYVYDYGQKILLSSPGEQLMPLNPTNVTIVRQIETTVSDLQLSYLHDSVLSRSVFSIESDFVQKNPTLVRPYAEGDTFDPSTEIKLFTNDKAGKAGRARWYIAERGVIKTGLDYLDDWKVIVSSANAGGQKRSNQISVIDNYSAFGRSRVALKTFKTEKEARNFLAYAQSDLIRFAFLLTDESLTSLAKLVPDIQNYADDNGRIDFGRSLNQQLYELFGIDRSGQEYIREMLREKDGK